MYCKMIITGTRMRRLYLTGRRGKEMMRIGRCRKGGGRVGGEGWIDGKCVREDDNGGLVCFLYGEGIVEGVSRGIMWGLFYAFMDHV
jgi:hypothetical protein